MDLTQEILTAEAFLAYGAALLGIPKKEAVPRIRELLELVGLGDVGKKKLRQYSGGMRQRVGCDTPQAVCARLQGKVFEVDEGTALGEGQFLLSERQGETGTVLRLCCEAPPEGAREVLPNLEDAFLWIYREGQT